MSQNEADAYADLFADLALKHMLREVEKEGRELDVRFMDAKESTVKSVATRIATATAAQFKEERKTDPSILKPGVKADEFMRRVVEGGGALPLIRAFSIRLIDYADKHYKNTGETRLIDRLAPYCFAAEKLSRREKSSAAEKEEEDHEISTPDWSQEDD